MTTTRIDVRTLKQQDNLRKHIETHTEEFLAHGGKITVCPDRTSAYVERAAVRGDIKAGGAA
jgi:hypothetical protein